MENRSITVNRNELYEQVWSEPVSRLPCGSKVTSYPSQIYQDGMPLYKVGHKGYTKYYSCK